MSIEYFSVNRYPGDGVTTVWDISFAGGYIDREHVKAFILSADGVQTDIPITDAMFVTPFRIDLGVAAPVGGEAVLFRDTPKDVPLVDFQRRSRLTEANLDKVAQQSVFGVAEIFDAATAAGVVVAEVVAAGTAAGLARDAAQAARDQAQASATAAAASASSASTSASNAASEASAATAQAGIAATQASNASGSASAASGSASAAAASATSAQSSANSAAASAAEAAASAAVINPANFVQVTGDQTIGGIKTFTSQIVASGGVQGNVTGNAGTVTNGVYTTGDQTIGGIKTFTSAPVVPGINGGQLAGFRNLLINGNFQINQRGYVSGTNVGAANTYTLDRWRVVTSGQNVTFTASGNGNQITAPAGGIEQVIEGINIGGGTYVLNWAGTATATVNGTALAKGASFTLPANTNATVRLIGGTASQVQLEPGTVPTPFEHRPIGAELALCQRYFWRQSLNANFFQNGNAAAAGQYTVNNITLPVAMRATPTCSFTGTAFSLTNIVSNEIAGISAGLIAWLPRANVAGNFSAQAQSGSFLQVSIEL